LLLDMSVRRSWMQFATSCRMGANHWNWSTSMARKEHLIPLVSRHERSIEVADFWIATTTVTQALWTHVMGPERVLRGDCFHNWAIHCMVTKRYQIDRAYKDGCIGFRLALS
jgi:formylglycine-generating enzyme required for sulfatase activity